MPNREDKKRTCTGGAWGAADRCLDHEGLPIGEDGYCIEGRPIDTSDGVPEEVHELFRAMSGWYS